MPTVRGGKKKTLEEVKGRLEQSASAPVNDDTPVLSVEPPTANAAPEKQVPKQEEVLPQLNEEKSIAGQLSQEPPPPLPPQESIQVPVPDEAKKQFPWLLLVIVLFVLILLAAGWKYFISGKKPGTASQLEIFVSPTSAQIEPTKVASEEVKLDKYPIKVLNGSGIAGEASKVKTILEDAGYTVDSTGNAGNYDYTDTVIQSKKNLEPDYLANLKALLKKTYVLGKDQVLSASEEGSIVVIVGSKKSAE